MTPLRKPGYTVQMRQHLGGFAVLLLHLFLLIQGTPGMDYMDTGDYDQPAEKAKLRKEHPFWAPVVQGLYDLNREVRRPLTTRIHNIERVFRISQDWNLYRDGPGVVRRLEIRVDGELLHRSADPEHAWMTPQLRNRRIRPVLENAAREPDIPNWSGVMRYVIQEIRLQLPGAREALIIATRSPFPGTKPEFHHGWVARAPDWHPEAYHPPREGTPWTPQEPGGEEGP